MLPRRALTPNEREKTNALLRQTYKRIEKIAGGDPELVFAIRRRMIVKLTHAERGTPAQRNALKRIKLVEQNGLCPLCDKGLPLRYAELDRFVASSGYTVGNTRLVHHRCHIDDQAKKKYR